MSDSLSQSEEKPGTSNFTIHVEKNAANIQQAGDINLIVGGNNSSKGIIMSLLWLLTHS